MGFVKITEEDVVLVQLVVEKMNMALKFEYCGFWVIVVTKEAMAAGMKMLT